ncbi:hypothetical protein HAX54_015722 [Datura stramonium]|uniref:Uncharacterized protein n=1 Tax=Datura stramonium TaxID=4076 RepID=A0ABS8UJU7_DATST|nr:hypothetical protein [Datura stramonium]
MPSCIVTIEGRQEDEQDSPAFVSCLTYLILISFLMWFRIPPHASEPQSLIAKALVSVLTLKPFPNRAAIGGHVLKMLSEYFLQTL